MDPDIAITPVTAADPRLHALTYPRYRPLLTGPTLRQPWMRAFAAHRGADPVGLAIIVDDAADNRPRLVSLAVAADHRRLGIGRALIGTVAAWAVAHGRDGLHAWHAETMAGAAAWTALMAACGWQGPTLALMSVSAPAVWAVEARQSWAPLFRRLAGSGYGLTPWADRSAADEAAIAALAAPTAGMAPRWVARPLPAVSVVIRDHGVPVGWVLGTAGRSAEDIYYPVGYVAPPRQQQGWLIAALVEVCLRQIDACGAASTCGYQTAGTNRAMQDFMLRRLAPWRPKRRCHLEFRPPGAPLPAASKAE